MGDRGCRLQASVITFQLNLDVHSIQFLNRPVKAVGQQWHTKEFLVSAL